MRSEKRTSRIIGMLLLLQLAGLMAFVMLLPLSRPPGFLTTAAAMSFQIKLAVALLLINGLVTIGITIAAFPIFRPYSYGMALWLLAFSVVWLSLQLVDNANVLSMLSLSQEYVNGGALRPDLFAAPATVISSTRKFVHFTELLIVDSWIFIFHGLLWRSRLVPRVLAGFGLLSVALHTAGISLPLFLGYSGVALMGVWLAVSHLAVALWLMVKGFDGHRQD